MKSLVQAVGRLHNFVIDERLLRTGVVEQESSIQEEGAGPGYLPSIPHDENGNPIDIEAVFAGLSQRGYSELRERMVDRVEALGLERPLLNRRKRSHNEI